MTTNRKYLSLGLTGLMIVLCTVLLIVFHLITRLGIFDKAEASLDLIIDETTSDEDYYYSREDHFDVYYIDMSNVTDSELTYNESIIYDYYTAEAEAYESSFLYSYRDPYSHFLFMPLEDEGQIYIYYVNIYPMLQVLSTATWLLTGVMVIITLIVAWLGFRTARALDASDQRSKNFFANASHELKTPLMAIQGYAEGMQKQVVTTEEASTIILKESQRMTELVDTILNLSKFDSGMMQPNMVNDDLREVLYEIIDGHMQKAAMDGIDIRVDLQEPLIHRFDENMMYSVLSNILINNLRYAKTYIEIRSVHTPDTTMIHISNDGEPIPRETIPHLFDRFYKGKGGQTGIGLALSMEYMRALKGSIAVTSDTSLTTFTITLPSN